MQSATYLEQQHPLRHSAGCVFILAPIAEDLAELGRPKAGCQPRILSMGMYSKTPVVAGLLSLFLGAACGGDSPKVIVGKLDQGAVARIVPPGTSALIVSESIDQIWAMPIYGTALGSFSFEQKIIVPIESDGSFEFAPPSGDNYDYLLALVDSTKCTTDKPRADWTESDIDNRLQCIQGYVAVPQDGSAPNASGADSMSALPVSLQLGKVDVGTLSMIGSYATSEDETLESISGGFEMSLGDLKNLARVDGTLASVSYFYANKSDDLATYYSQIVVFDWLAESALESAHNKFTSATDLKIRPYSYLWGTNVDPAGLFASVQSTDGYLQITPPEDRTFSADLQIHGPSNPITSSAPGTLEGDDFWTDGLLAVRLQGNASGNLYFDGTLPTGEWTIERDGEIVSKYDVATSAPFEVVGGVADESSPLVFVPSLKIVATNGIVDSIEALYTIQNGSEVTIVPFERAVHAVGHIGFGFAGDGASVCPSDNHERTGGMGQNVEILSDRLRWTPQRQWKMGASDATHCGVTNLSAGYTVGENAFQWHWSIDGEIY
jgi:hypothetical protein